MFTYYNWISSSATSGCQQSLNQPLWTRNATSWEIRYLLCGYHGNVLLLNRQHHFHNIYKIFFRANACKLWGNHWITQVLSLQEKINIQTQNFLIKHLPFSLPIIIWFIWPNGHIASLSEALKNITKSYRLICQIQRRTWFREMKSGLFVTMTLLGGHTVLGWFCGHHTNPSSASSLGTVGWGLILEGPDFLFPPSAPGYFTWLHPNHKTC